ncbi:lytic transglycosylase domain-containing protein [Pararhodobacter zhoushanensis]|uniref:lytic transglycosylase domain-containing protein n=1 Tax=Pararhodobacter zhoushanensis TaxID=2479545 RepID=UPI000F8DF444|nr:lytic transglycosylase domain-containing protein [Pararhodobacter zhoushanensis]
MRRYPAVLTLAALGVASPALSWDGPPPPRAGGAIGALVSAVRAGDAQGFAALRDAAGPVGVRVATWRILREGIAGDFSTYVAFEASHRDWPGMDLLRARAESRMADQPPDVILSWFATRQPQTGQGYLALLAAQVATGADPTETLRILWLERELDAATEEQLLATHGDFLRPLNAARLDALLWDGERAAAERMMPRVTAGQVALARARLALQARADGVDAMISAVSASLADDPGLAYDRFRWRLARGMTDGAAELLRAQSADNLGRPEAWAGQRARLSRNAMDAGDAQLAYDLAANHGLTDHGSAMADLEWLAGYIALRFLNRPAEALGHFQTLRERSVSPITLGRAGYWEGRAQEALGNPEAAQEAYAFGALYQTAFYGQLAAERIGQPLDPALIAPSTYPDWHTLPLANSEILQAALLLHASGQWYEARRFTLQLAENLETEAELGSLAQLWLDRGEPNFALRIAKLAITRGILLPHAYFPVTELATMQLAVPADLVLSIARRESEFDPRVVSPADARGLMQVMPATGAHVARQLGVGFEEGLLTSDPAYNAVLGAGYLQEMSEQFGGTLSMVAAAYNAGPGRPTRWARENGDPRDPAMDPVDWVEMIPFTETRNYVMRVTESVVLYRALLAGESGPIRLTDILRGRD